jgi:hypothetical protein
MNFDLAFSVDTAAQLALESTHEVDEEETQS